MALELAHLGGSLMISPLRLMPGLETVGQGRALRRQRGKRFREGHTSTDAAQAGPVADRTEAKPTERVVHDRLFQLAPG